LTWTCRSRRNAKKNKGEPIEMKRNEEKPKEQKEKPMKSKKEEEERKTTGLQRSSQIPLLSGITIKETIGEGNFGRVFIGSCSSTQNCLCLTS